MSNYGFIPPSKEDIEKSIKKGFVLGAVGGVRGLVINPLGNWEPYLPKFEPQRRSFDSFSCTQFGTLNALETLETFHDEEKNNYSERALAIASKNTEKGNDPHKVADILRKVGIAPEELLSFTDKMGSWKEYMTMSNVDAIKKAQKEWIKANSFKHEWVFADEYAPEVKRARLKEALRVGTVCVSVRAWKEQNGVFVKGQDESDNHWTQLFKYDGDYPIVNDSYLDDGRPIKKLDPDYSFQWAKVFYLSPRIPSWWERLFGRLCYN